MKKIIIYIFLSLSMLFIFKLGKCQTPKMDLDKYWHYRWRLTQYFMAIGIHQGQSLPANQRNLYNGGLIAWGDVGRTLGYYIGTLATEYRILKDNAQPLNETIRELYYALHAVYRLDSTGQLAYSSAVCNFPGCGFMISDDVDANFINRNTSLNYNLNPSPSQYFTSGLGEVFYVNQVTSGYSGASPKNPCSQDNYYASLMGLALTVQLVDNTNLTFFENDVHGNPIYHTFNLYNIALQEGQAILNYFLNDNFSLKDPSGNYLGNAGGGDASTFEWPLSQLASNIFQDNFNYCGSCHKIEWENYNIAFSYCQIQNIEMALTLAAISNSWGIDNTSTLNFIQSLGNYDGFTAPCPLPQYIWANHYGWDLFYSAILGVMYPQYYNAFNFPYDFCKAQAILDAAPSDGPFAHSASDSNANGWAAVRRFIDSPPEQTYGETSASNDWAGNYNGLDYMLFYNLYYLISEKVVNPPSLIPYTTIYSTIPAIYPCGVDCGDYSDPAIDIFPCSQIVVNYLDVKGGIAGGGNLQLQGGPSGILLNPVSSPYTPANMSPLTIHIENGGLFKATVNSDCSSSCYPLYSSYINEYNTPSLDYARMSSGNDSSSTLPSYKMNNEFASLPNSNAIMSYPNPAIDEITVEFALKNNTPISMYLCDANGNRLKNIFENTLYSRGLYVIKCSLSNINAGTYFCVLLTKDDKKTTKIIKIN